MEADDGLSATASNDPMVPLRSMLYKLKNHPDALIFLDPVDRALNPDYDTKIKQPIDLSTMEKKLDEDLYQSFEQLEADVNLMLSNCFQYNPKKSYGYKSGVSLQKFFQTTLLEMKKTKK
jgi:histone acetyltransferase